MNRLLIILALLFTTPVFAQVGQPVSGSTNVSPVDCSGTITTGGTAQVLITGFPGMHGFQIMNIDTTEPLWMSFTDTAAAATSGSYAMPPAAASTYAGAGYYSAQLGFGSNTSISIVAATTGHKFSCTRW